jgi:hypothetical protein
MARTNYDPLEKHPLFDGTLDPDIDDEVAPAVRPRPAPNLDQVGVIALLFGCDVAVLVNEPRKPVRDVAGNYW